MFRVFLANYVNLALSFYDLAALANFLDRWFYLHLFFPVDNPASLLIVRGKFNHDPVAR